MDRDISLAFRPTARILLLASAACLLLAACSAETDKPRGDAATPASPSQENLSRAKSGPTVDAEERAAQAQDAAPEPEPQLLAGGEIQYFQYFQPNRAAGLPADTERYADVDANPIRLVAEQPVSTFSIDVDTAAYSNVRRFLSQGVLPPRDAVRIEEMINYFDYAYSPPEKAGEPFAASIAVTPTPWNAHTRLLHIGIKGYDVVDRQRPRANLVFLVDVSGSMSDPDKLPLVKQSLRQLVGELEPADSVALVVYAGNAGTVLEPTPANRRGAILAAIDRLESGGSTAGGEGIRQAYELAEQGFAKGAVNRVLLATDGDFNVGITDPEALEDFVARKRETGIYLSVLGFGEGNLNDLLMQKLAQAGNGNAAYIDSLMEARKVLVEEAASTLFPIADDVKIQVEFNPAVVAEYRLIGYETRALRREDFNNDAVDAGEIGSGHAVTALYEITPRGSQGAMIDPLRYGAATEASDGPTGTSPADGRADEIAFLRIRYKLPGETASRLIERPIGPGDGVADIAAAAPDVRFAAAVAAFGQILRGDPALRSFRYDDVIALAQAARGDDRFGYRAEFVQLVRLATGAQAQASLE